MLNAAVAESLRQYADELEKSENFEDDLHKLIKRVITDHQRILFDGNGYGDEWVKEATEVRGLSNLKTTADAMPHLLDEKNKEMLLAHKVFTEAELESRCEIMLENYVKQVNIEGLTMVDMVRKNYLPAMERYIFRLAQTTSLMREVSPNIKVNYEVSTMERLSELTDSILEAVEALEKALATFKNFENVFESSEFVRDDMLPAMDTLRKFVDEAEMLTSQRDWPFPSYGQLLFSVN
jgi:glutamine synthetase